MDFWRYCTILAHAIAAQWLRGGHYGKLGSLFSLCTGKVEVRGNSLRRTQLDPHKEAVRLPDVCQAGLYMYVKINNLSQCWKG